MNFFANTSNMSPKALAHLANSQKWRVRGEVTNNPNTPEYVRDYLNAMEFVRSYGF
jgi:hypothetical protein